MDGKTLVYDALKLGSKKLPNIDPFHDIEPLIIENFIPVKTNIDAVCLLDQEKLDSYRTQKKQMEMTNMKRIYGNPKILQETHWTCLMIFMTNHFFKMLDFLHSLHNWKIPFSRINLAKFSHFCHSQKFVLRNFSNFCIRKSLFVKFREIFGSQKFLSQKILPLK